MKVSVVVLLVVGMLVAPLEGSAQVFSSHAQQNEQLSQSVVQSINRELAGVLGRLHSGARQPGDFARAEASLRILFEHAEATGVNDRLDAEFRQHGAELRNMRVTTQLVNLATRQFGEAGLSKTEVEVMLKRDIAKLPRFLEEFETVGGMRGYEARMLAHVHARSVRVERQAKLFGSGPLMHLAEQYACAETEAEGGLLAAGFGVATLFGCVPCGAIAAGLLFGAALIQFSCVGFGE